jgi:MoxR-like ATPase
LLNDLIGTKKAEGAIRNNGFIVFGTQNPAYLAGREITSSATKNRFLQIGLSSYTKHELYEIERKKHPNITEDYLKKILREFIVMQKRARKLSKEPASYRLLQEYLDICEKVINKVEILSAGHLNQQLQPLLDFLSLKNYRNQPTVFKKKLKELKLELKQQQKAQP